VEQNNCLGIYLSKKRATAVLLSRKGSHPEVLRCFSVQDDAELDSNDQGRQASSPAAQIAQKLASEGLQYGEVAVSLDCTLYTQHNLHSEFTDHKQIANTIIFDAEEALARDATDMALTFTVTGTNSTGSLATVFSADRAVLNEMLDALQSADLDPTAIEPDILCLARFLEQNFSMPKDANPLFVLFSDRACHIIKPQDHPLGPLVRSFVINASQNKTAVLAREIPLTLASMNLEKPADSLFIADQGDDQADIKALSQTTGIPAQTLDPAALIKADKSLLADCDSQVEFATACGAAIAEIKHIKPNDFRQSFAPYLGKKMIMQRTLRATSVFVTISMIALGLYFQLKVMRISGYVGDYDRKMRSDFVAAANYGKPPRARSSIIRQLERIHSNVKKIKEGNFGDEGSIPAKLTYMLEAINEAPPKLSLQVSSVSVTSRAMSLIGSTNRRASTNALYNSLKAHEKLDPAISYIQRVGRDAFTITLDLKK
jgi:Tfp pilus assembly PilM family ATPase